MCKCLWVSVVSSANSAWLFCSSSSFPRPPPILVPHEGITGQLVSSDCRAGEGAACLLQLLALDWSMGTSLTRCCQGILGHQKKGSLSGGN